MSAATAEHPPGAAGRMGVLLVNLGTPEATDYWSMRRYLAEFLADRRVIEENRIKWCFILNLISLSVRPRRKGRDYDKIWNRELDESPLKTITRSQAEKLAATPALEDRVRVDWAMRYGNPSIASRLRALQESGCDRILIMPLYPQYAAATTATVCDKAFEALMQMRRQPAIRVLPPYYDDAVYIDAVASSLEAKLVKLAFKPEVILVSFHGMPKAYVLKGDPYHDHCAATARLLRERLELDEDRIPMSFPSAFRSAERLPPLTAPTGAARAEPRGERRAGVVPG